MSTNNDGIDDKAAVEDVVKRATVEPLSVNFDVVEKNVAPAKVRIRDYGRDIEIDGVRATRTYRFTGGRYLFALRPNHFASIVPYGAVDRDTVTVGLEAGNVADSLKGELDRLETTLRDYVQWQRSQIEEHNGGLRGHVEPLVNQRRKYLDDVARLKDEI